MAAAHSIADVGQWEIWQVYWDHGDGTGKDRPAVAISTPAQNNANGYARFVKITGEDHPEVPCRLKIDPRDQHFAHTGLDHRSWIHFLDDNKVAAADLRYRRGHISAWTVVYLRMRLEKLSQSEPD